MNRPRLKHHKQRIALATVHAKGTRVSEAVELGAADTGSRQITILVARGGVEVPGPLHLPRRHLG